MASVNKVILIGNLGKDPEIRYTQAREPVAALVVATNNNWIDKATGEKKESTEWHRVSLFRKQAEIAEKYMKKGSQIYIEGELKTHKWQDRNGQDRYTTEIVGKQVTLLGRLQGNPDSDDVPPATRQQHETTNAVDTSDKSTANSESWLDDEDCPF